MRGTLVTFHLVTSVILTPLTVWLFGWPVGIMLALAGALPVLALLFFLVMLWAGRGGRNPWQ